jgi:type IV secretory pathway VirB2 component (pilin)
VSDRNSENGKARATQLDLSSVMRTILSDAVAWFRKTAGPEILSLKGNEKAIVSTTKLLLGSLVTSVFVSQLLRAGLLLLTSRHSFLNSIVFCAAAGMFGASNSSWGLPVKGVNFICPGIAQQEGRIIES